MSPQAVQRVLHAADVTRALTLAQFASSSLTASSTKASSVGLMPGIPARCDVVCESGLNSHADLMRMARLGVTRFLVGESLMRQADVALATRILLTGDSGVEGRV